MDSPDCVTTFAQTYQTIYRKVLLVTKDDPYNPYVRIGSNTVYQPGNSTTTSTGYGLKAISAYPWLCPASVSVGECANKGSSVAYDLAEKNDWNVTSKIRTLEDASATNGWTVQYCLAEPAPQKCSLEYSETLISITVACNVVKTCVLLYLWLRSKEAPLLTVGDAIASFLRRQDPHSRGMCLPTDGSGLYIPVTRAIPRSLQDSAFRHPVAFTDKRKRRGSAIASRWGFFIFLYVLSFSTTMNYLCDGNGANSRTEIAGYWLSLFAFLFLLYL